MTRLKKGQHPDTHPDFWNDWSEPKFPEMTSRPFWTFWRTFGVIAISLIALKIGYDLRQKKKARLQIPNPEPGAA